MEELNHNGIGKITQGIPVPKGKGPGRNSIYEWVKMEVDDSFFTLNNGTYVITAARQWAIREAHRNNL
jgi:hypothetical protein